MPAAERRQVPRTKLEKLAYIHIEPNNGGIVLNVSGDGLGFHSMAPVEHNGPLRFSLQEQNRRIDVCGELVWTDEIQKVGGLRFTTLTTEAREQIHTWANHPAAATAEHHATLSSAFLRAFPSFSARRPAEKPDTVSPLALVAAMLKTRVRLKLSGFSGGVATGLLISALAGLIFLFSYAHRRQFGESLIHLGERLASKPEAEHQAALPKAAATPIAMVSGKERTISASSSPARPPVSAPQPSALHTPAPAQEPHEQALPREHTPISPQVPAKQPAKVLAQPLLQTQDAKLKPPPSNTASPASNVAATPAPSMPIRDTGATRPFAQPNSSGATTNLLASNSPAVTSREFAPANYVRGLSDGGALPVQMFFDLGRFKQESLAQDLSDRVARLGLHASVVQKGHLWMNSYQVLVGPYGNEEEEKKIHTNLLSHGYKPRPFERGSRGFAFRSQVTIGGDKLPVGDFTITWESYVADAKVKFAQGGGTVATADGKWVKRPMKYSQNEYVYENVRNGSRPLLEIHFSGQDRALVFRESP